VAKLAYHDCHISYITKLRNNSDSGQILQAQTGLNLANFSFFFSLKYGNFVPFFPQKIPVKDSQPPFFWANNCPKTKHCN
jgi:hypothetical protein